MDSSIATFNGAGEYVALDALGGEFLLQARSEPAEDSPATGTASFSAFAMKMRNSDTVEIQRNNIRGRLQSTDSLFTYMPGQSSATFSNPSFMPVLDMSDLPFASMPGVAEVCGSNQECMFDVGATGDVEVGQVALEVQMMYSKAVESSQFKVRVYLVA